MAQTQTQPDPWPDALKRGYEPEHMRLRWFLVFVISIVVLAAAMFICIWFIMKGFAKDARQLDPPRSIVTDHVPRDFGPPLQPTEAHDVQPEQDLEGMRQDEDQVFANLGWKVDREKHRAQVPEDLLKAVVARMQSTTAPTTQSGGLQ